MSEGKELVLLIKFNLNSSDRKVAYSGLVGWFIAANATFSNILVISWWSVLLVGDTGVSRENHLTVASQWQTLSHNVVSSTPLHEWGLPWVLSVHSQCNIYTCFAISLSSKYMYSGNDLILFDLWCLTPLSAISWRPVLVVEEAGVPGENHRPWASNWLTLWLEDC